MKPGDIGRGEYLGSVQLLPDEEGGTFVVQPSPTEVPMASDTIDMRVNPNRLDPENVQLENFFEPHPSKSGTFLVRRGVSLSFSVGGEGWRSTHNVRGPVELRELRPAEGKLNNSVE